jgi:dsDNA-specific endonuclease/ATPase MutS2
MRPWRIAARACRMACFASFGEANTPSKTKSICMVSRKLRLKRALHGFLAAALARHLRCVGIIHGKGRRSGDSGPVLKQLVSDMLRRSPAIVAYVSARPADGGTGAVYVLLSSS